MYEFFRREPRSLPCSDSVLRRFKKIVDKSQILSRVTWGGILRSR